jgi:fluoride exporter
MSGLYTAILVGTGGFAGSIARWVCQQAVLRFFPHIFPFGTFAVNLLGSFFIGWIYAVSDKNGWMSAEWRWFLATGFCGGFTTFSAFSFEILQLLKNGHYGLSAVYIMLSLIAGVLAVWAGWLLGR